jgi:hypothetical protein
MPAEQARKRLRTAERITSTLTFVAIGERLG